MYYKYILVFCVIIFGFIYCQKENSNNYNSAGIITGQDMRMCPTPCCGGWYIRIDSVTYEFGSLPANSNVNLAKDTFPLAVKLDWELSKTESCSDKWITISRIARQ